MHFFSNEEKQYVGVQKNDFGHALHAVRFPPPPLEKFLVSPQIPGSRHPIIICKKHSELLKQS